MCVQTVSYTVEQRQRSGSQVADGSCRTSLLLFSFLSYFVSCLVIGSVGSYQVLHCMVCTHWTAVAATQCACSCPSSAEVPTHPEEAGQL
eukprot:599307-Amphidinium_carterae.1